jgi:hypothetical protein
MNIMLLSVSVWAGGITDITPETRDFFHWLSALIALPAAAFAGQPFFASALKALRTRHTNMDVPISIGVTLALGVSLYETAVSAEHAYFDSAVMLLFFLLAGRTLDHAMRRKTRAAAGNLAALKSATAEKVLPDGASLTVPAAALSPGDTILARRGDRIAADATVIAGVSAIDESLVSGETLPRTVRPGDTVYAGTLNRDAVLTLAVSAAAGLTLVDEVRSSSTRRPKRVRAASCSPTGRRSSCAGGAPDGGARRGRLDGCRRRPARGGAGGDHRPHHHLSLCARPRHPRRAGRRRRRPLPPGNLPQRRRCHRAARRGRYHRLRQDRHAHPAGASRRQRCRFPAGAARVRRPPGPVQPPSARRGAGGRSAARRPAGAVEEPGRGIRAVIAGVEARLGNFAFLRHRRAGRRRSRRTRRSPSARAPRPRSSPSARPCARMRRRWSGVSRRRLRLPHPLRRTGPRRLPRWRPRSA